MSITALVIAGPSNGSAPQRKRASCTYSIGGARDIADHLAEPDYPVGQPAVADLGDAGVDIRVVVKDLADDQVGEEPRGTPRMGGCAGHHGIAPDVAVAGEVG